MAEQPNKPRNIKDLKARLGRTISPQQSGMPSAVPPPTSVSPGAPHPGGAISPPQLGPLGSGLPGPLPPGGRPSAPPPAFLTRSQASASDPFAAAASAARPPAREQVRLVIDEAAVDAAEVGKRSKTKVFLLLLVGMIVGGVLVGAVASTISENRQWNYAVQDGHAVYQTVRTATNTVNQAKVLVERAITTARPSPGHPPSVDYEAIQQLQALERPIDANAFHSKRYAAFGAETVNQLFEYYNNVGRLWQSFELLANRTLPPQRREILDAAARSASEMATQQTGCVPVSTEGRYSCRLVFVRRPEQPAGQTAQGDAPPPVQVATSMSAIEWFEREIYTGQDLSENPENNYVILTDTQRSPMLAQGATPFAQYVAELAALKQLLESTAEVQGQLERGLSEIAALQERFAL